MRGVVVLFAVLLAFTPGGAARAAMLGDASISYRAERTVTVNGRSYTGPVFHRPGQDRHEQEIGGMQEVFLLDDADARGYLVLPGLKSYLEFDFPRLMAKLADPHLRRSPAGEETVNGVRTTKYHLDYTADDGSRAQGFVWVSGEGVLMRLDGTVLREGAARPTSIFMELAHLRPGPQDPGLFEPPAGFYKLPTEALTSLLGGRTR